MWNVSTAIRGYLRYYMRTNILLDLIRTRRGLKWGVPAALVLVPAYLFAACLVATIVESGGPGWLNVLVLLFCWNAMKFAALVVARVLRWVTAAVPGRENAIERDVTSWGVAALRTTQQ